MQTNSGKYDNDKENGRNIKLKALHFIIKAQIRSLFSEYISDLKKNVVFFVLLRRMK